MVGQTIGGILMRLFFALAMLSASLAAADEKPVEIPLDQIWSHSSAEGAKSLRSLEPGLDRQRTPEETEALRRLTPAEINKITEEKVAKSLVLQLERAIQKLPLVKEANKTKRGFAISGVGPAALPGVHDVLVRGKKPSNRFRSDADVSLVFFSHPTRARVAIDRIEREGKIIRIHFMLISHGLLNISSTLAMIPLGQLQAGEYRVEMIRSPNELKHNQPSFPPVEENAEQRIICRPFEFSVEKK
jgi:hypothetical protein